MKRLERLESLIRDDKLWPAHNVQQALAYSSTGTLFSIGRDSKLRSVQIRSALLDATSQEAIDDTADGQESGSEAYVQPPLSGQPESLHINRSGTYAIAWGVSDEDEGRQSLSVICLIYADDIAEASPLTDPAVLDRSGLAIMQVEWHPFSDSHFAVLTSDNVFRLYHVDDLDCPEQQVELQLRGRRPLGQLHLGATNAIGFAFGSLHLWERFTVYFACEDGRIFVLTPIVPFGAVVAAAAVVELHASCNAMTDATQRSCSRAWLQRVFPIGGRPPAPPGSLATVTASAASLDDHAPAAAGPLTTLAPGGVEEDSVLDIVSSPASEGETAVNFVALRGGTAALALATSGGEVALLAVADTAQPRWVVSPPQCRMAGDVMAGLRMQSAVLATPSAHLLLLDCARLPEGECDMQLLLSPDDWEVLYAFQPQGMYCLKLPWLPSLSALVDGSSKEDGSDVDLPPTQLQAVAEWAVPKPDGFFPSAAVVGDAMLGTAVVVSDGAGAVRVYAPHVQPPPFPPDDSASPSQDASAADEEVIQARYGEMLAGPPPEDSPGPSSQDAKWSNTPQGQRRLNDAIVSLRRRHVEYQHQACHDLTEHTKRLASAAEEQVKQLRALQERARDLRNGETATAARLERAAGLRANLDARLQLLGSLHHSLPRPLSAAETHLRAVELPALERASASIQASIADAQSRWVAQLAAEDAGCKERSALTVANAVNHTALPPQQAMKLKHSLKETAKLIAINGMKVEAAAVALQEAGI